MIVNKTINLYGEDRNSTVIDGSNSGTIIWVFADWVTIKGFTIQYGFCGINLHCSNSSVLMNTIIQNSVGIKLYFNNCSYIGCNNTILRNSIHDNEYGMIIASSDCNEISCNTIISNNKHSIYIHSSSSYNTITNNNFTLNNESGLFCNQYSYYNKIYHNNFRKNTQNAYDGTNNSWDNGYPSCGNYWDNYIGVDIFWGPNQNLPGSDGVGDRPYDLPCERAIDNYPLKKPYGMTKLTFMLRFGLFKFSGTIKNIGNNTAFNVQWEITIEGGLIIFGRHSSGPLLKPLLPGKESTVSTSFILGFGPIKITTVVGADNALFVSRTIGGFLFFFFYQLTPCG